MERIKKVLQAYAVYPLSMEKITNQLSYISDGKQAYALKESILTKETLANWKTVYEYAHSQNLTTILPVYLTKRGDLYATSQQSIYYLTPWISNHADADHEAYEQTIKRMYHLIGTIHGKTKQSRLLQKEKLKERFLTYQTFCSKTKNMLLDYVKRFERNQYMSPFELLVCTQYHELEYALNTVMKRVDQFLEGDDDQFAWNDCLCHGNLLRAHMIDPYIINWEYGHQGNAVLDLVHFIHAETAYYNKQSDLLIELFPTYNKENELSVKEHYLLTMYLLNPAAYISKVQAYSVNATQQSMIDQIMGLQHEYRKISFGLAWSAYVEKEHESSFSIDDMES